MLKRSICLLAAACCLFAALAGCGKTDPEPTASRETQMLIPSTEAEPDTTVPALIPTTEPTETETVLETVAPTEPFEPYITYNDAGKAVVHVPGPTDNRPRLRYVFNPHALSSIYRLAYGEEIEAEVIGFCDAVLAGEDRFPCTGAENWQHMHAIMRNLLPICVYVDLGAEYEEASNEDGFYPIRYTLDHSGFLAEKDRFVERVTELIEEADLREGDSDLEKALKLFTSSSLRLVYDYAMDEYDTEHQSAYRALMGDTGICAENAGAYAYLLLQAGVDAAVCTGSMLRDGEPHGWTVFRIGESWFHADVTWQLREPYKLQFFGNSDFWRYAYGLDTLSFDLGACGVLKSEDLLMQDEKLYCLQDVSWYAIDHENGQLLYYDVADFNDAAEDLSNFEKEPHVMSLEELLPDQSENE